MSFSFDPTSLHAAILNISPQQTEEEQRNNPLEASLLLQQSIAEDRLDTFTRFCADKSKDFFRMIHDIAAWFTILFSTFENKEVIDLTRFKKGAKCVEGSLDVLDFVPNIDALKKSSVKLWNADQLDWYTATKVSSDSIALTSTTCKVALWADSVNAIDLGEHLPVVSGIKSGISMWTMSNNIYDNWCEDSKLTEKLSTTTGITEKERIIGENEKSKNRWDGTRNVAIFGLNFFAFLSVTVGIVIASPMMLFLSTTSVVAAVFSYFRQSDIKALEKATV